MVISNSRTFPFFLRIFQLLISSMCILVASKMYEVWMSNCCRPNSVCEASYSFRDFTYLKPLWENIHTENFSRFLSVPILANYAFRSVFFNILLFLNLFDEFVCVFLCLHLSHYFLSFLLCKTLFLISLFIDLFLEVIFEICIVLIIIVSERTDDHVLRQNYQAAVLILGLG